MPEGGAMGALIRATDWSGTSLGDISCWPEALRLTTGICLDSQFAIAVWWAADLIQLYNDAYRELMGEARHRNAYARSALATQQEMLPKLDELAQQVMECGEAVRGYDLRLVIERNGYPEDRYFTFSFSPIRQSDGIVAGMLVAAHERTAKMLVARRLRDSDARLVAALNAAKMASWEWDLQSDQLIMSDSATEVFGLPPGEVLHDSGQGFALVHPDDVARHRTLVESAIAAKGSWHGEFRIVRPRDGEIAWLEERGMTTCNAITGKVGTTGLVWDVTASKRAEDALRLADRRKDEFLATLAHELRNPLAPIRSAAHLLGETELTAELLQRCREIIDRQAGHMTRLLEDLLDVSRITSGRLDLKKRPVTLREVVDSAVETVRPMIDIKAHLLHVKLPDETILLDVDPLRIAQVLTNLLTNAAKYTDREGRIELDAAVDDGVLTVTISDNGIGVAAQDLPHLFEMFSQVSSAIDRSEGGLGIGLALSKGLLDLHGGRIAAHSRGLGQGMRFVVRLPLPLEQKNAVLAPSAPVNTARHGKTILLIDDNRDAADCLSVIFQIAGYRVLTAYNGLDGLATGAKEKPHIVILDIGMPKMNGYEVASRMRGEDWGRAALLIAATGWGQETDKRMAYDAGFDHHLTKPFDPREALAALAQWEKEKGSALEKN
ncbi:MAG TPA: ATP-binding protein [Oxalicibacterium sp.]|uniref:hybrid sensor histidine kinase/response regulator n=1 Tax=Oxalicibacterium sp. TaxID=2766525 RepID=UPI002C7FA997|nr:ATP-binding protein [Oxalicibacterium sp.]HWU98021.1 ATP-binding protein [Oxalicibacterium sp.]